MAVLLVLDDGLEIGEAIRIRGDRFVIGRTEGDLVIPHDARISSKHVEITRRSVGASYRWVVTDLQSTNGLFVRVRRGLLADGSEFLVGAGRYQFVAPSPGLAASEPVSASNDSRDRTLGWDNPGASAPKTPSLQELVGAEVVQSFPLMRPEYWIGSDPSCSIPRPDDRFCDARHTRLLRSANGEWVVEHHGASNGLWLRMNQLEVTASIQFQLGEQRFQLKIP